MEIFSEIKKCNRTKERVIFALNPNWKTFPKSKNIFRLRNASYFSIFHSPPQNRQLFRNLSFSSFFLGVWSLFLCMQVCYRDKWLAGHIPGWAGLLDLSQQSAGTRPLIKIINIHEAEETAYHARILVVRVGCCDMCPPAYKIILAHHPLNIPIQVGIEFRTGRKRKCQLFRLTSLTCREGEEIILAPRFPTSERKPYH